MTTVQRVILTSGAVAVIVAVATAPRVEVTKDGLLTPSTEPSDFARVVDVRTTGTTVAAILLITAMGCLAGQTRGSRLDEIENRVATLERASEASLARLTSDLGAIEDHLTRPQSGDVR